MAIEIMLRNGYLARYESEEWDSYNFTGKAFIVRFEGRIIGIYNFEDVMSIEVL